MPLEIHLDNATATPRQMENQTSAATNKMIPDNVVPSN